MLWDLNEGKHLYTLDGGGETINALCFSPNRYWLCAATGPSIKIWVCIHTVLVLIIELQDVLGCRVGFSRTVLNLEDEKIVALTSKRTRHGHGVDTSCALILSETLALYKSFTYLLTLASSRL